MISIHLLFHLIQTSTQTYYQLNFNLKLRKFQSIQKANKHIWTQILTFKI